MLGHSDGDLRILVVSDDPLARAGLAVLLADQPGCAIVGQVSGTADVDQMIAVYRPDALVWELGWEAIRETPPQERAGSLPDLEGMGVPAVLLLPDEACAADAWLTGARGLLMRDATARALRAALFAVVQNLIVLDPVLAGALLPDGVEPSRQLIEVLTPRELEVLQMLAEGLPNKGIAHQLGISDHTVKFHVNAILGKLSAQSRTEAVVQATRLGLIIL